MRRRASRRRRSPTPISPSRTTSRSSRSSTRSTCPARSPKRPGARSRTSSGSTRATRSWRARRRAPASTRSSRRSCIGCRAPTGDPDAPLKALIFDSWYDPYRGVIILTRVIDGVLQPGQKIRFMANGQEYSVEQVGVFSPKPLPATELGVGEVGLHLRRHQERRRRQDRRHDHRRGATRRPSRSRGSRK